MPPFLQLHALAARRGDGLRPELRILLERLTEAPESVSNSAFPSDHLAELIEFPPVAMPHRAAQPDKPVSPHDSGRRWPRRRP